MSPEPTTVAYTAALGQIAGAWVPAPYLEVDAAGTIVRAQSGRPTPEQTPAIVYDLGHSLLLPGLVNAHSHAFQRAIRGATHRRGAHDPSSFWSWREAMYRAANRLDPETLFTVTRDCYREMLRAGITCVGEFHYLHHAADGRPHADPAEMSIRCPALNWLSSACISTICTTGAAGNTGVMRRLPATIEPSP